jgi:hypothetical protein
MANQASNCVGEGQVDFWATLGIPLALGPDFHAWANHYEPSGMLGPRWATQQLRGGGASAGNF